MQDKRIAKLFGYLILEQNTYCFRDLLKKLDGLGMNKLIDKDFFKKSNLEFVIPGIYVGGDGLVYERDDYELFQTREKLKDSTISKFLENQKSFYSFNNNHDFTIEEEDEYSVSREIFKEPGSDQKHPSNEFYTTSGGGLDNKMKRLEEELEPKIKRFQMQMEANQKFMTLDDYLRDDSDRNIDFCDDEVGRGQDEPYEPITTSPKLSREERDLLHKRFKLRLNTSEVSRGIREFEGEWSAGDGLAAAARPDLPHMTENVPQKFRNSDMKGKNDKYQNSLFTPKKDNQDPKEPHYVYGADNKMQMKEGKPKNYFPNRVDPILIKDDENVNRNTPKKRVFIDTNENPPTGRNSSESKLVFWPKDHSTEKRKKNVNQFKYDSPAAKQKPTLRSEEKSFDYWNAFGSNTLPNPLPKPEIYQNEEKSKNSRMRNYQHFGENQLNPLANTLPNPIKKPRGGENPLKFRLKFETARERMPPEPAIGNAQKASTSPSKTAKEVYQQQYAQNHPQPSADLNQIQEMIDSGFSECSSGASGPETTPTPSYLKSKRKTVQMRDGMCDPMSEEFRIDQRFYDEAGAMRQRIDDQIKAQRQQRQQYYDLMQQANTMLNPGADQVESSEEIAFISQQKRNAKQLTLKTRKKPESPKIAENPLDAKLVAKVARMLKEDRREPKDGRNSSRSHLEECEARVREYLQDEKSHCKKTKRMLGLMREYMKRREDGYEPSVEEQNMTEALVDLLADYIKTQVGELPRDGLVGGVRSVGTNSVNRG